MQHGLTGYGFRFKACTKCVGCSEGFKMWFFILNLSQVQSFRSGFWLSSCLFLFWSGSLLFNYLALSSSGNLSLGWSFFACRITNNKLPTTNLCSLVPTLGDPNIRYCDTFIYTGSTIPSPLFPKQANHRNTVHQVKPDPQSKTLDYPDSISCQPG